MSKLRSLAKERAALNVARLFSGELSDQQAREQNGWRVTDTCYQAEFLANAHLLADVDKLQGDAELLALLPRRAPSDNTYGKRKWFAAGVVATVVMMVAIGFIFYGQHSSKEEAVALVYSTQIGEIKKVALSDGSAMVLNTGSRVMVAINDRERNIILERGEAYFEVVKDEYRPFSVDAGSRKITVLGTAFNIYRQPDVLRVSVNEGTVCVHSNEETASVQVPLLEQILVVRGAAQDSSFRLTGGWIAEINDKKQALNGYRQSDYPDSVSTWRKGVLQFTRQPLYKVVQELNRYRAKKILIESPDIQQLRVSAVVKIDRTSQALRDFEELLDIKVTHYFDRVVLTSAE